MSRVQIAVLSWACSLLCVNATLPQAALSPASSSSQGAKPSVTEGEYVGLDRNDHMHAPTHFSRLIISSPPPTPAPQDSDSVDPK